MRWINLPDLFCATSETVTNMANVFFKDERISFTAYTPMIGL
jgi:hypothetical protein